MLAILIMTAAVLKPTKIVRMPAKMRRIRHGADDILSLGGIGRVCWSEFSEAAIIKYPPYGFVENKQEIKACWN